jgi:hypothetical protein
MRNLIISALAVAALGATAASAATVVNGSFEDPTRAIGEVNNNAFVDLAGSSGSSSWDVWSELNGWASTGAGIEIQTDNTIGSVDAQDGEHYVELASHGAADSTSAMKQGITFSAGTYLLSFYYSPRTGTLGENGIKYGVEGVFAGVVSGPTDDLKRGEWTEVTQEFTVGDGTNSLFFSAIAGGNSTLGGLIDNVSISAVPLPASSLLLLAGLGGLGAMRRRKKA